MAFLTFRGNSTSPTKPSSTTAADAPLTNVQIDGNFASLNDSKVEKTGGTISGDLGVNGSLTVSGTTSLVSTNDTTSTSLYPMLVAASGTVQSPKVSTSKLYFDASNGTLNSTSFNSLSDKRFKKDLSPITDALEKIKHLTGYTYTLIDNERKSAGLIAQEVELVQPESIGGNEDKKTIDYGSMIGLIVEAIKDLDNKIESIKSIIENR